MNNRRSPSTSLRAGFRLRFTPSKIIVERSVAPAGLDRSRPLPRTYVLGYLLCSLREQNGDDSAFVIFTRFRGP